MIFISVSSLQGSLSTMAIKTDLDLGKPSVTNQRPCVFKTTINGHGHIIVEIRGLV